MEVCHGGTDVPHKEHKMSSSVRYDPTHDRMRDLANAKRVCADGRGGCGHLLNGHRQERSPIVFDLIDGEYTSIGGDLIGQGFHCDECNCVRDD